MGDQYFFFSDTLPDGRLYNAIQANGDLDGSYFKQALGIGMVRYQTGYHYIQDGTGPDMSTSTDLIYYAKGTERSGSPYYIDNGTPLIHYTPIPEDCATWNKIAAYPPGMGTFYEQIRTGAKHFLNNHTYVELVYRSYDSYLNQLTMDSLIGFFRNDTAAHQVLYRSTLNASDMLLYDFRLTDGDSIGSTHIYLDTLATGGRTYTRWNYASPIYTPGQPALGENYLEGIGGMNGFLIVKLPFNTYNFVGSLSSFCLCAQSIYPDANAANCSLLTGVANIGDITTAILYPNPASDQLYMSFADASQYNVQLILSDILGQTVYSSPISTSETTHDISNLSAGIYTWRLVQNNAIIKTGKIVKQ
jgi:hypothetical protein